MMDVRKKSFNYSNMIFFINMIWLIISKRISGINFRY